MAERVPKRISFLDYPHAPGTEVPPEVDLKDGSAYTRDEVQDALSRGSGNFILTIIEVDEGLPPLE